MAVREVSEPAAPQPAKIVPGLGAWWVLAALTLAAAILRLSTIDLQSLWYDEAFTPVHTLHASLSATLSAVSHTENSPPLWYLLEWGISRVLGTGAIALRLLSAIAGVLCVPVAWAIGRELSGPRVAIVCAALVAVNPLFVWYSQEARVYGLFVLMGALSMLCFLRARQQPTPKRMALFALSGSLALLTHYFAVFLLMGMAIWLLYPRRTRRAAAPAVGVIALTGAALIPLISAQGGHGTQWIGQWALSSRLQAIPQYYLTGYSGAPLGHAIEFGIAAIAFAGVLCGLWRTLQRREERAALLALALSCCGVLIPLVLVAFGVNYLAPRNLVAAMIPLTALLAVVIAAERTGSSGLVLGGMLVLAFLAITIDVNLSPRLQRGDWRGVARLLRGAPSDRVISTVELGGAPLEYYLPGLHNLATGSSVRVSEIDETGYAPLRADAEQPPAPGFHLLSTSDVHGLILYRFRSPTPRSVSERTLRLHVITEARPEVLAPAGM